MVSQLLSDVVTVNDELLNYLYQKEKNIVSCFVELNDLDKLEYSIAMACNVCYEYNVPSLLDLMERNDVEKLTPIVLQFSQDNTIFSSYFLCRMFLRQYVEVIQYCLHRNWEGDEENEEEEEEDDYEEQDDDVHV